MPERCEICGEVMPDDPERKKPICQTCDNAIWEAKRADRADRRAKKRSIDKPCACCGAMMVGVAYQRKYCPACASEMAHASNRQAAAKYAAKHRRQSDEPDAADIARQAAAEGLSYGQYVSRHGL